MLVGLAQHQLVVAQPEGVPVHGHGVKVHIGVASFGLTGRASIKIPDWQFCKCKQIAETSSHLVKSLLTIHFPRGSFPTGEPLRMSVLDFSVIYVWF